jgi:hypothetical protein
MVHSTVMGSKVRMRAMGEGGCLFDEISNLVEPTERRHTGEQHCGERRHRKCRPVRKRSRTA